MCENFGGVKPGQDLQIKACMGIVHVWCIQIWLHCIGQANQNTVLSKASMCSMLLLGGRVGSTIENLWKHIPPGKFLKLHALRLNLRAL